ncbi:MAG: SusD/RagB family nutrient-binding outer membrane lipoprotein [Candidatus Cyclobacteriaceae bacterium M3_2C_046]
MKHLHRFLSILLILFLLMGCENYLDINEDPNNPTETSTALLLPSAEINLVTAVGMGTSGLSSYLSVYMHQTTRRAAFDAYNADGTDFAIQQAWSQFYSQGLQDIKELQQIAVQEGSPHYYGLGQILKAYAYSVMVDVWGDIPFSTANDFPGTLYPEVTDDETVYNEIFNMIETGIDSLNAENSFQSPGGEDLLYEGDLELWQKFANTLKLKLYNQIRLTTDVSAEVQALLTEDNLISGPEEDFQLVYGTSVSPENRNPGFIADYPAPQRVFYVSVWFYQTLVGKNNNILTGINDPRLPYYFFNQLNGNEPENPEEYKDGDFLSIYFGSTGPNQGGSQDNSQTVLGLYPYGGKYDDDTGGSVDQNSASGAVPQRILTYTDRLFIEAELALAGVTNANDSTLFHEAMLAAFDKLSEIVDLENGTGVQSVPDLEEETISDYVNLIVAQYSQAGQERKLEMLMTQKWIASFGYSIDQYNDYRRTGYPVLYNPDTDNIPFTNSEGPFPMSLPYSQREIELNSNNIQQKNDLTQFKVFWDVN